MKKSLLTTLVYLFSIVLAVSAPVDEQKARKLASDFLRSKMPATRSVSTNLTRAVTGVVDGPDAAVYVFNTDNAFVIISGDDSTMPVLGYCDKGKFDVNNAPDGLKDLIRYYQQEVKRFNAYTRDEAITIHDPVAPLIKTTWNQTAPYNLDCPIDTTTDKQSVTGCVATAMAQVMYYYQYPDSFAWNDMKLSYAKEDTTAAAYAVAKLMADVGNSVYMDYFSNGSSASPLLISEALRYDFGYSETTEYVDRTRYTSIEWDELVYNELKSGRPVLFGAQAVSPSQGMGGHQFIIDGYDDQGYYHVNWGWGGSSDGFFMLSVLNPYYQSTGGNSGSSGYNFFTSAVVGIMPAEKPMKKTARLFQETLYIENDMGTYTRTSSSEGFPAFNVKALVYNAMLPEETRNYDVSFDLYQDDEFLGSFAQGKIEDVEYNYGRTIGINGLSISNELPDGKYQIRLNAKESVKIGVDWALCLGGLDCWIDLDINGLIMTTKCHGANSDESYSFDVDTVVVGDTKQQAKIMKMKIELTSKNKTSNAPIFLWGTTSENPDEPSVLITGVGSNLDPNETGVVELEYTPQRSGKFTFYLSGNYKELSDTLYTFTVDVAEMSMAEVVMDYVLSVDDAEQLSDNTHTVAADRIKGSLTLTNNGTETYEDALYIILSKSSVNQKTKSYVKSDQIVHNISVPVSESIVLPFEFANLINEQYYAIRIGAIEKGKQKYLKDFEYSDIYFVSCDTGIDAIRLDAPDAEVYDIRGVRLGKASELKSLPKGVYIINKKKVINK